MDTTTLAPPDAAAAAEITEQQRLQIIEETLKEVMLLKNNNQNQLADASTEDLMKELLFRLLKKRAAGRAVALSDEATSAQQLKDRTKHNKMDTITALIQDVQLSNDNIASGRASNMLRGAEASEKERQEALRDKLVKLELCFREEGPPQGSYVMDNLSCIPFDPTSDWSISNNISSGKDQWWSRLKYEFDIPTYGLAKGDVIPIFGAHIDLHPRASSAKMKNYGKSLVNVYLPTNTVAYLAQAVKDKTGMNIAEGKEIVDVSQGLTSFLMGPTKGVDVIPCKMYQPITDEDDNEQIVDYNITKMGLNQLYMAAANDEQVRVLGGVAFVHLGVTFSCAPDEISRSGEVPKGSLVDLKFKLVSFHCLSMSGHHIKKITYRQAPNYEY